MTETPRYDPVPASEPAPPASTFPYANASTEGFTNGSGDGSTMDVAKDRAGDVKDSAKEAAATVAGTAKDQAGEVVGEAKTQARDLLSQSRAELTAQASTQQQRAAGSLHALSSQLHDMSANASEPGLAQDLTSQVATHAASVASWLEGREPGAVLDEVREYARRRPGTFLALCAGAGVLAGRLARGAQADAPDRSDGSQTAGHQPAHSQAAFSESAYSQSADAGSPEDDRFATSGLPGTAQSPDGPLATPASSAAADDWAAHDASPAGHP